MTTALLSSVGRGDRASKPASTERVFCLALQRRATAINERTRVNQQIRISPVRVIDPEGEQIGILSIEQALEAAEERGLDLVEVAPMARPPVCRIMDYGKFRYE